MNSQDLSSRTGVQLTTKWGRKVRRVHDTDRKKKRQGDNKREVLT